MKTKKLCFALSAFAVVLALTFTGCKKRIAFNKEDGQETADTRSAQGESDAAVSDINQSLSDQPLMTGRTSSPKTVSSVLGTICGLTIDASDVAQGSLLLNYNGTTCSNRTRTGSIRATIVNYAAGQRWKNAGCIVRIDYYAYKVTRASDGKSIQLDGTQYITNISGGTWVDLLFLGQPNLTHSVTGDDLAVTFDGSATAHYNIYRKFTYTWDANANGGAGVLTCVGEGIGTSGGLNNLENYGTTREGDWFTSQVTTPVVWNTTCGAWAPIQGEVNIKVASKYFDLKCLFGVDTGGNPVTVGANSCPYGWKVEWKYKNKTKTKTIGYW